MIVYKVVRRREGGYFSTMIPQYNRLCIKYVLGKPVSAPAGGIFCFKTLEQAQDYWYNLGSKCADILVCRARKDTIIPLPVGVPWPQNPSRSLRKFWRDHAKNKSGSGPLDILHGTILLRSITPLRVLGNGPEEKKENNV